MIRFVTIAAVCLSLAAGSVQGQMELFPLQMTGDASDWTLTADKLEGTQKTGDAVASGHARLKKGDTELLADRMSVNRESGDVLAEGNVQVSHNGIGQWQGERMTYNLKTGRAVAEEGTLKVRELTLTMDSLMREGDDTLRLYGSSLSTCTNEQCRWHWRMDAKEVRARDNHSAVLKGAVPYMFGIPFAYLPYWYKDLNTHYGVRLLPAYNSKWGASLLGAYVWNIIDLPKQGLDIDAKTHIDGYMERGVGLGQDFMWKLGRFGSGKFTGYWIYDQDPDYKGYDRNWSSPVDRDRYIFTLEHNVDITPRDQFWLRGTYVSDSQVMRDFMESSYRHESQPINRAAYEHREHSWLGGAAVSGPLNDFYGGVARLPEGYVHIMPQNLGWRFFYESETRAGYYSRQPQEYKDALEERFRYTPGFWADYDSSRVDTKHFIKRPISIVDGITITPRAGWRGTAYSNISATEDDLSPTKTRSLFELGTEGSLKAVADYTTIRHTFNPYFDYTYIANPAGAKDGSLYAFDRTEQVYEWQEQFGQDGVSPPHEYNALRLGMRNIFQELEKRDREAIFDFDVYGAWVFENGTERWMYQGRDTESEGMRSEQREKGMRLLGTKAAWRPAADVGAFVTAEYDPDSGQLAYGDMFCQWRIERFLFSVGYITRDNEVYDYYWRNDQQDSVVYGRLTHQMTDAFSWNVFARGNTDDGELEEIGGYIQYRLDCMTFHLYGSYMPTTEREDGSKYDQSYRMGISVWLNAAGKDPSPQKEWNRF